LAASTSENGGARHLICEPCSDFFMWPPKNGQKKSRE